ncbi:fibronectin type III domain-containing protein [Enterococcus avium]|uniref:fibronectin type III domain-containing protein n=1 Tax=Enterococcus avium TaxID=33945 RepID=UPI002892E39C|nr:fibronectin type III domain-containing protein [Enterococcus avium]
MLWNAVDGAKAYIIHYGNANQSNPSDAAFMGYSETANWSLNTGDVPTLNDGDQLYFYVQTYNEVGIGDNDVDKAQYLHDGSFTGSEWSEPAIVTKNPS